MPSKLKSCQYGLIVCLIFEFILVYMLWKTHNKPPASELTIPSTTKKECKISCEICKDSGVVINPRMKYLRTPQIFQNECLKTKSKQWRMVIFVMSAAHDPEYRDIIRSTWGSITFLEGGSFQLVFVVGKSDDEAENKLNKEEELYHDVLQIDVQEKDTSMADKSFASLQWAAEFLSKDDFYTKAEGHVMVNVKSLKYTIDNNIDEMENNPHWPTFPIICHLRTWVGVRARRDPNHSNYNTKEEYKWSSYPAYCSGPLYSSRVDTITELSRLSKVFPKIHKTEDAWVTGVLRRAMGMPDEMIVVGDKRAGKYYEEMDEGNIETFKNDWNDILSGINSENICFKTKTKPTTS